MNSCAVRDRGRRHAGQGILYGVDRCRPGMRTAACGADLTLRRLWSMRCSLAMVLLSDPTLIALDDERHRSTRDIVLT